MSAENATWPNFNMSVSHSESDSGVESSYRGELYENIEEFRSKSLSPSHFANTQPKIFEMRNGISHWTNFNLNVEGVDGNVLKENTDKRTSNQTSESASSKSSSSDESSMSSKQRKDLLHRDIEKRRRDRINKSLAQLRELIPSAKGKMSEGNARSEKLQKAKLLELAVEYLEGLKNGKDGGSSSASDLKQDPVILESAKQVYLSGYKAGLNHVLLEVSSRFQLSQEEIRKIITSLTSVSVKIPNIFLVPQNENETKSELKENSKQFVVVDDLVKLSSHSDSKTDIAAERKVEYEPAPAGMTASKIPIQIADKLSSWGSRSSLPTKAPVNNDKMSYDKAIDNILYPRHLESPASKKSHVLLSTYVLDPYTSRYYPTMLPLEDLMLMSSENRHVPADKYMASNELLNESQSTATPHNKRRCSEEVAVIQNPEKRKYLEENYGSSEYSKDYRNSRLFEPKTAPAIPSKFEKYYMEQMFNHQLSESLHSYS